MPGVLHLLDASLPPDPLASVVVREGQADVLRANLSHAMLRWRAIANLRRRIVGKMTVVAWDVNALSVARKLPAGQVLWRAHPEARRVPPNVTAMVETQAHREQLLAAGALADSVKVVPPAAEEAEPISRVELGVAEEDRLWLLTADGKPNAGLRQSAWVAVMLHVVDQRYKVLLWGEGPGQEKTAKFIRNLGLEDALIRVSPRVPYASLARVADAGVFAPPGAVSVASVVTCLAAGLPIVASPSPQLQEYLEDGRTALLTDSERPRVIEKRMLELMDDAECRRRLSEGAITAVRELSADSVRAKWDAIAR